MKDVSQFIDAALPAAREIRRRLHAIPELGYAESKTAALIRQTLKDVGLRFVEDVDGAPTAVIATIGDRTKPCIALRADIDALPISENSGVPYASTHPGAMHACGHDGHTAILLATAMVLKQIEAELPVCAKLVWQPAEEFGAGGRQLVDAGVLDGRIGPKTLAAFALHCSPELKLGTISTCPGALMASIDNFQIEFKGSGGHAAYPHSARDPVVTACEAVVNLQQFVSREFDPTQSAVLSVTKINSGSATNIIPESATIIGTVRTLRPTDRETARAAMLRRCSGIAAAGNCTIDFQWTPSYPATINDSGAAAFVATVARDVLGPTHYKPAEAPGMGGEDFAYFLQKVPGCYFWLGMVPEGRENLAACHSDRFDFNDDCIGTGVRMFVEMVRRFDPSVVK